MPKKKGKKVHAEDGGGDPGARHSQPEGSQQGGQGRPPGEQQGPQQGGRGRPPKEQQGDKGGRGPPPSQQQGPQQGGRGRPPSEPQGAWGGRGPPPSQQQVPQQGGGGRPPSEPQGAWGRGPPLIQQQVPQQGGGGRPPSEPQGAWGGRGPPPSQQQGPQQGGRGRPASEPQGAWGGRGPLPSQQQVPQQGGGGRPPSEPQGAWGRGPPPSQQQVPQQGGGGRPPSEPQGAWGGRGRPPSQQQGPQQGGRGRPPSEQQGARDSGGPPPSQGVGHHEGQMKKKKKERTKSQSSERALEFAPRIYAQKRSGTAIIVAANFFRLIIKDPNVIVCHYDVVINPDRPKFMLRSVWKKFASMMFPNRVTAFDGKNAYSRGPLTNDKTCSATVTVVNPESNREKEFNVSIEKVREINLLCFQNYREKMLQSKSMKVLPEAEISVLDIIMRNWAAENFVASGKHFFPPMGSHVDLSDKLIMKFGYFQAAFLGYVPYVNFDISHKAFYRNCGMLDVVNSFKDRPSNNINENEFNHYLKNVKIEYQLPGDPSSRRVFRVNKLVLNANAQTFEKEDGTKITVAQYFANEKKCKLKYPDLPLLWVGSTEKSVFLPMEFCRILPDQIYKGMMDSRETREMVQKATSNAFQRFQSVNNLFRNAKLNSNPLMKEFGLSVADEMEKVPAHILEAPTLRTKVSINVKEGVWRSRNFLEPVSLTRWCILNTDKYTRKENLIQFQNIIKSKGADYEMKIGDPSRTPMDVDASFAALKKAFSQLKNMEIVFVIISEAKSVYSRVKTICETQEGVLTQCVKSRTLSQDPRKLATTVENILLKVNSKLGGKNHSLNTNSMPDCLKGYTMIIGADVTHASPGMKVPSVAAVAASSDVAAFQYGVTVRVQPKGEIIKDLQEIVSIHLKKFYESRKKFPEKIIFFRDGVSEGELPKVFKSELMAIKNACNGYCQPKITLVIVQKRHHARFFPTRREDEQGRNLNVPVGTCVDSHIIHPRDMDFYLVSHASLLGTARPTRYRLLYDDNKLTDEELEKLSYYLCHMFSRCNRSVSYPSPTFYAHLGAFRARAYLDGLNITNDQDIPGIQKKITDTISKEHPMFFV